MSLNDNDVRKSTKSKIPRYIGRDNSRNGETRKASTDSKAHLKSRSKQMVEPKCRRRILEHDNNDIQFEPDPQALQSILNNEGISQSLGVTTSAITPKSGKTSCVFNYPSSNRMSMWESHTAFKQSLKLLRERLPQSNHEATYGSLSKTPKAPGAQSDQSTVTTIDSGKRSSIYYQPSSNRTSMMESYLQHKENMRMFREKMQQISNVPETPNKNSTVGHKFAHHRSKTPLQSKMGSSKKTMQHSAASQHMENNRHKMSAPHTTTTTMTAQQHNLNSYSAYNSKENRPLSDDVEKVETDNEDRMAGKVLQDLTHSVHGIPAPIHGDCCQSGIKIEASPSVNNDKSSVVSRNEHMSSIVCGHSVTDTIYFMPQTQFTYSTASSSNNLKHVATVGMKSSAECTWSNPKVVCTPSRSQPEALQHSVPQHRAASFNQNKPSLSSNQLIVQSDISASLTQTSAISYLSSLGTPTSRHDHQPTPSAGMLHSLNKLTLSSTQALSNAFAASSPAGPTIQMGTLSESVLSIPSQWPTTPSPAPVRVQSVVTPVSQPTRIAVQVCASPAPARSPFTPISLTFLNQPPKRTPALSSCLKMKSKGNMPVRNAVTSVKKLRWADAESPVLET